MHSVYVNPNLPIPPPTPPPWHLYVVLYVCVSVYAWQRATL